MWGLLAVVLVVAAAWVLLYNLNAKAEREREARRKRYAIPESAERVPLAEEKAAGQGAMPRIPEMAAFLAPSTGDGVHPAGGFDVDAAEGTEITPEHPVVLGRLVNTPDGEMILTSPPFSLRESILTKREAAYAAAIRSRLPRGLVLCPKVRLDTLVVPTAPDGRDPEDWRVWRRRVRTRAVDLVICDRRGWRPVVAIEIDRPGPTAGRIGGGVDRMIDEVLTAVGLPLVRCTGDAEGDWGMIAPYLKTATASYGGA